MSDASSGGIEPDVSERDDVRVPGSELGSPVKGRVSRSETSSGGIVLHLCPKCGGQGHVNKPPWIAGDQPTWMSTNTGGYTCPVCHGIGYLELSRV